MRIKDTKDTNRPETALYRKVDGKFEKVGYDFEGFPSNGVWLVKDGSQNLIEKLGDIPDASRMPKTLPITASKVDECCQFICDNKNGKGYSFQEVAKLAAEFYARDLNENYPEVLL